MFLVDWFYGVLASLGLWQKEAKILFLGFDNFGKTILLDMLKGERRVLDQRVQYPTSEELGIGKIKFKAFDLGDLQTALKVLKDYHAKVDAVVYVVDALGGRNNFDDWMLESRWELRALLRDDSLANVPVLVLGDRIIIPPSVAICRPVSERCLRDWLGLGDYNVRPLEIFMCRIVREKVCCDGFKWLSQYIN